MCNAQTTEPPLRPTTTATAVTSTGAPRGTNHAVAIGVSLSVMFAIVIIGVIVIAILSLVRYFLELDIILWVCEYLLEKSLIIVILTDDNEEKKKWTCSNLVLMQLLET